MGSSDVALVGFVRSWFDRVNGNSYLAGDVWEVFTGRVIPVPFQYGRDPEAAVRSAAVELGHLRLVLSVVEVATEAECRHGGALQFCGELPVSMSPTWCVVAGSWSERVGVSCSACSWGCFGS